MSLEPQTCPYGLCDGTGFVVDEATRVARPCRCRPQRVERRRARSLSAVIPKKYRHVSFDLSPVTELPAPQVQMVEVPASDHHITLDNPEGFIKVVREFLRT